MYAWLLFFYINSLICLTCSFFLSFFDSGEQCCRYLRCLHAKEMRWDTKAPGAGGSSLRSGPLISSVPDHIRTGRLLCLFFRGGAGRQTSVVSALLFAALRWRLFDVDGRSRENPTAVVRSTSHYYYFFLEISVSIYWAGLNAVSDCAIILIQFFPVFLLFSFFFYFYFYNEALDSFTLHI